MKKYSTISDAHSSSIVSLQVTVDGRFIISASLDKSIRIFSIIKAKKISSLHHVYRNQVVYTNIIWTLEEPTQFLSIADNSILHLDTRKAKPPFLLWSTFETLNSIAISKDYRFLFLLINGQKIKVLDLKANKEIFEIKIPDIQTFATTIYGDYIVIGCIDKSIKVFKNPVLG